MNSEKRLAFLQQAYAGVLADSVRQFGLMGVLDEVTARKKQEQLKSGGFIAAQLGIKKPEEVFTRLSEIFNCATWDVKTDNACIIAETTSCMLAALSKKAGALCPCSIYCLNPMEGMIKAVVPNANLGVRETLWTGKKCRIEVSEDI